MLDARTLVGVQHRSRRAGIRGMKRQIGREMWLCATFGSQTRLQTIEGLGC